MKLMDVYSDDGNVRVQLLPCRWVCVPLPYNGACILPPCDKVCNSLLCGLACVLLPYDKVCILP